MRKNSNKLGLRPMENSVVSCAAAASDCCMEHGGVTCWIACNYCSVLHAIIAHETTP